MSRSTRWLRIVIVAGMLLGALPLLGASSAPDTAWHMGPTPPFTWSRFDGYAVGRFAYFLGGRQASNTFGAVYKFNISPNGTFVATGATMPVPISNYTIAGLRDRTAFGLYTFGGRDSNGNGSTAVQAYYPSTNTAVNVTGSDPWPGVEGGNITLPGTVEVVANKAYAIGGAAVAAGTVTGVTAQTWIYNPAAADGSKWTAGPALAHARAYMASAVVANRFILAIGGDIWDGAALVPQVWVEMLDTQNLQTGWVARADIPTPSSGVPGCDENRAFSHGGEVIMAGCGQWNQTGNSALPDSFEFDFQSNTWSSYQPLNVARRNFAHVSLEFNGHLLMFVFDGYDAGGVNEIASSEYSVLP